MHLIVPWIRFAIGLAWLVSPSVLAFMGLWRWKRQKGPGGWKAALPVVLATAVSANWILLIRFILRSQTPYGAIYQTSHLTGILLLFSFVGLIVSVTSKSNWQLSFANLLLMSLWIGIVYAQAHWLTRVDFGTVAVDDHRVPAAVYFGNPTDSEAEAIALAHVPGVGDYFLDFSGETFREVSKDEFIPLHYGVWTLKSMREGQFRRPLPFRNLNECRIPLAGGHVLTVAF